MCLSINKMKQKNIFFKISFFAAVPFFGFYTTKIGISPIYFTFLVACVFLGLGYIYSNASIKIDSIVLSAIGLLIYLIFLPLLYWDYVDSSNISAWVNIVFSLLNLIVISLIVNSVDHRVLLKGVNLAAIFSVILLFVELIYRFSYPYIQIERGGEVIEDLSWYAFKTTSFMYGDSNSIGLFAACLFIFVLKFKRYNKSMGLYLLPIGVLLIGSLSRASILSTVVVSIFVIIEKKIFRVLFLLACTVMAIVFLYLVDFNDDSLGERFWIASLVIEYIIGSDLVSLLTGGGPGSAEKMIGVGAHLLPFTWLLELGILGASMQIILWYLIWKRSPSATTPLFLIFILNGFAFTTFAIPWFYVMIIIIIYCAKREEVWR